MPGIIKTAEIVVSPRGRKAEFNEDLLKAFKSLKADQGVTLDDVYGLVMDKDERAAVSQKIRKHWSEVRDDKPRIDYSPTGVPQVRVRAS